MFFLVMHYIGMDAKLKVLEVLKTDNLLVKLAITKRIKVTRVEFFAEIFGFCIGPKWRLAMVARSGAKVE